MRWLCVATLCVACGGGGSPTDEPITSFDDDLGDGSGDVSPERDKLSASPCEPYVSPWSIGADTCSERAEMLRQLYEGVEWDRPVLAPEVELPRAADWKPLPADGDQVRGPVLTVAPTDDAAELGGPLEQARQASEPYVIVLADEKVPMVELADLAEELPGKKLRLGVRKPRSAFVGMHVERYSWTPDWVKTFLEACQDTSIDPIVAALESAAEGCEGAGRVIDQVARGASADVVGPVAAAALLNCECEARDTDGFASLLVFATSPFPDVGWVPLPAKPPRSGRVGDWVGSR